MPTRNLIGKDPDQRVKRSRETVIRTTLELLTEAGLGGISVDEIARRSGVAKTTIYRHWPTRSELVIDACSQIGAEQETPDTGDFEGDLITLLTNLAELLSTARWSSVVPSIVDAAERDNSLAEIHSRIQRDHAAPLRTVIERAVQKGEIPKNTDRSTMIAALLGPLFYRRWFSREPLDAAFVKGIVQNTIGT